MSWCPRNPQWWPMHVFFISLWVHDFLKSFCYGWHRWLDGHEFEQAPRVGDGWESLVCYSTWGPKKSDITERLHLTELMYQLITVFILFDAQLITSMNSFVLAPVSPWHKSPLVSGSFLPWSPKFIIYVLFQIWNQSFTEGTLAPISRI